MSGKVLLQNGALYRSGEADYSWMVVNPQTGYIEKMGRGQTEQSVKDSCSDVVDCGGRRVLPGLIDSHIHLGGIGLSLLGADLRGSSSIKDMQERLADLIKRRPGQDSYYGRCWEQDLMGRMPTKEDLDEVCRDTPVVLSRYCGHLCVVNSLALHKADITRDTPDPVGGAIDRYPEGHVHAGEPTGVLREIPAMRPLSRFKGPLTEQQKLDSLHQAIEHCLQQGLTTAQTLHPAAWHLYTDLADNDKLNMRIFYIDYLAGADADKMTPQDTKHDDLLMESRLKLFSDGSLGGSTAAMTLNYTGTENNGMLIHPQEDMTELVNEANIRGHRLEIHAIGDRALDVTLTALENAGVPPEKRPVIAHCQVVRDDQLARMKACGAIANIQPSFVPADAAWAEECLPQKLLDASYPWKTLMESGVHCSGGSDAPVEPPNVLKGIYDAVYRPFTNTTGKTKQFRPEECLTIEQAVDLYTKHGAFTAGKEDSLGQLRSGFLADFVILDAPDDVMKNPDALLEARPNQVWVAGKRRL